MASRPDGARPGPSPSPTRTAEAAGVAAHRQGRAPARRSLAGHRRAGPHQRPAAAGRRRARPGRHPAPPRGPGPSTTRPRPPPSSSCARSRGPARSGRAWRTLGEGGRDRRRHGRGHRRAGRRRRWWSRADASAGVRPGGRGPPGTTPRPMGPRCGPGSLRRQRRLAATTTRSPCRPSTPPRASSGRRSWSPALVPGLVPHAGARDAGRAGRGAAPAPRRRHPGRARGGPHVVRRRSAARTWTCSTWPSRPVGRRSRRPPTSGRCRAARPRTPARRAAGVATRRGPRRPHRRAGRGRRPHARRDRRGAALTRSRRSARSPGSARSWRDATGLACWPRSLPPSLRPSRRVRLGRRELGAQAAAPLHARTQLAHAQRLSQSRSTTTGAWSDGCLPLRALRSITAHGTRPPPAPSPARGRCACPGPRGSRRPGSPTTRSTSRRRSGGGRRPPGPTPRARRGPPARAG